MATRIKTAARGLYEEDFYVWTERQAASLRGRRFEELDLDNLIEEVEALGRAERSEVLNNAAVILEHFLKLRHSPATRPRNGWRASVREHRRRVRRDLTPRLRQILQDELSSLYEEVRHDTQALLCVLGGNAAADALPDRCPYRLDQITGDWLP